MNKNMTLETFIKEWFSYRNICQAVIYTETKPINRYIDVRYTVTVNKHDATGVQA